MNIRFGLLVVMMGLLQTVGMLSVGKIYILNNVGQDVRLTLTSKAPGGAGAKCKRILSNQEVPSSDTQLGKTVYLAETDCKEWGILETYFENIMKSGDQKQITGRGLEKPELTSGNVTTFMVLTKDGISVTPLGTGVSNAVMTLLNALPGYRTVTLVVR